MFNILKSECILEYILSRNVVFIGALGLSTKETRAGKILCADSGGWLDGGFTEWVKAVILYQKPPVSCITVGEKTPSKWQ